MTLTELRYIVAVARERHFGRAAEACLVSQPTLSVAIKKLEEDVIIKHWRGDVYYLTDAGRRAGADKLGATASFRNHVLAGWRTATEMLREAGYQVTLPPGVKE